MYIRGEGDELKHVYVRGGRIGREIKKIEDRREKCLLKLVSIRKNLIKDVGEKNGS